MFKTISSYTKSGNCLPLWKNAANEYFSFQCPKPVIAAIHGACIGGATNMVTFADIRYCTNDSYFQVKEAALGMLCMFSAADLEIKNAPFRKKVSSDRDLP